MRRFAFALTCLLAGMGSAGAGYESPTPPETPDNDVVAGMFWTAAIRGFVGYSNNIQYVPDFYIANSSVPQVGGLRGGVSLTALFEQPHEGGFSWGGSFRGDLVGHHGGDNPDFNHFSLQPSVFIKQRRQLASGTELTLQGTYGFNLTEAVNWGGISSRTHQVVGKAIWDVVGPWSYYATGTLAWGDWDIHPSQPLLNRDGFFKEIAVGFMHDTLEPFHGMLLTALSAEVALRRNDAAGPSWSYTGVAVSGKAEFDLPGPFGADVSASFARQGYDGDFTVGGVLTSPRTWQSVTTFQGRLIWFASPRHSADLGIRHEIYGSDSTELTGDRTTLTAGVTVRLH